MTRTIELSIDKARKYYLSGNGDLRELALSAYSENELVTVGVPKTVEELGEGELCRGDMRMYKAHMTLKRLRDAWRGTTFDYEYHESLRCYQYCIIRVYDRGHKDGSYLRISDYNRSYNEFLSFQTREMAEQFLSCFRGLIEDAGELI